MSTIKVTNLQNASAASPAIVLDANSRATLNGLSYPTEGSLSGRNRIINGDMRIDQRNAGASVNTSGAFPVDRFSQGLTGSGVITSQRSTTAPAGFTNSLQATVTTADASLTSTDEYFLNHFIEGFNVADFDFGSANATTITISFWVRSSLTGSFGFALKNYAINRSYPTSYTINAANTWEYKTITVAGDTTGTWLKDNGKGLECYWSLGAASGFKTTGNAWANGNYNSATGTVDLISTSSATFFLTGVQVELGSVATPFERRSYGQEFLLAERYTRIVNAGTYGRATSGTGICLFPVFEQMRATPTAALSSGNITVDSGGASATASSPSVTSTSLSSSGGRVFIGGFTGLTTGDNWPLAPASTASIILSAEL